MGFSAFNDPAIQSQINLTPQQQMQIRRMANDWRRQLQQLSTGNGANANTVTQNQWNQLYTQFGDQLNSVLTPQQQSVWAQLTGQRYTFPYEFYAPAGPTNRNPTNNAQSAAAQEATQQATQLNGNAATQTNAGIQGSNIGTQEETNGTDAEGNSTATQGNSPSAGTRGSTR